jgi:serine/threonine-protein kinase
MGEELIGTRKGDYEILGVLGAGGMGQVYKVRNVLSDRIEAMKVLLPNLAEQKELADRFLREIKVLASLNHPNIAALRTALTIDNQLVMIMEYVEGTTLAVRVEQGAIPCGEALNYTGQVLAALSYAHQRQVIHRDIKPSNMILTPQGVIKLMDFGIARSGQDMGLTLTGTTVGSLSYMSPEQVRCEKTDARSDLYSVGVSLYEMVTGQRPFQADSNFALMKAHLQDSPKLPIEIKPELPVAVSRIILMAMEKDPAKRFQSADAFRNALQSVAADLGVAGHAQQAFPVAQTSPTPEGARRGAATIPMTGAVGSRVSPVAPAPVAQAAQMPPPQASGSNQRGLYITLGALIVVLVLVAAGFSLPRWFKTRANQGALSPSQNSSVGQPGIGATSSQPANPPTTEAIQPVPAASPARVTGGENPVVTSSPAPSVKSAKVKQQPSQPADQQERASGASAQPPSPDPDQLAELDHEVDLLSSRETAIDASLDTLQRSQNAQGLQLRGDIVAAQQRMQTYLTKARTALQAQDIQNAQRYLKLAEAEVEKLDNFLGR